jgi:vacuolar-type H+-ATPase subunit I/STV1
MSTDFFDEDLIKAGAAGHGGSDEDPIPVQPVLGATLGKMAKKKEEMSSQVATAIQEIERLRMRQEELEREKNALEELTRKQDQYERDKMDIIEKLERTVVVMEKEESQAARMVELLSESRSRFKNTLTEIRAIDEDAWTDQNFNEELNKSAALIENARMDYKKSLAKIEAASWHTMSNEGAKAAGLDDAAFGGGGEKEFGYWVKIGFAVSLPLVLAGLLLFGLHVMMSK